MKVIVILTSLIILSSFNAMAFRADIVIDGKFDDWARIKEITDDEGDTFGGPADATMDILKYKVANDDRFIYVYVAVKEDISKGKTSRGAYQTIIDADNKYDTGIQSDKEAPYPPHDGPIGVDRYISVETKAGQVLGIGMAGFKADANEIGGPGEFKMPEAVCSVEVAGNQYEFRTDLKSIGIDMESTIKLAILHYSAAGTVDWTMPAITYFVTMQETQKVETRDKVAAMWGKVKKTI